MTADWIIVLGAAVLRDGQPSGTLQRRVAAALAHTRQLDHPWVLVTGGVGRFGPAEAVLMRDQLVACGFPLARIVIEDRARDTLSSVLNCRAILRQRPDVGRLWVCTSRYHTRRCRLLLRLVGLPTLVVPMADERHALGWRKWLFFHAREIAAVPYNVALLLLRKLLGRTEPAVS